jgi:hypothetical protein
VKRRRQGELPAYIQCVYPKRHGKDAAKKHGEALSTPNAPCPALVSLVFFHTFFGLAQFCKKPCSLVFNVLQFFEKKKLFSAVFFVSKILGLSLP